MAATELHITLERFIDQQIELGNKNPHDVFPELERQYGDQLTDLVRPYFADLVAEMARQKLNSQRRQSIAKINPQTLASPELKLRSLWIPDQDNPSNILYKRIADMTAEDFDARALYLERMVIGISRHAAWCRQVASELRRHEHATANELQTFPPLPEITDVA